MRRFLLLCVCLTTAVHAAEGEPPARLKVASIQMEIHDDWRENLPRILRGIDEARATGARVVVFPEAALSGFSKAAVAQLNWTELAGAMRQVAEAARTAKAYVLYGCATPVEQAKPHNTALVIGPDGNEITRYHKMFPEGWFTPGESLALFRIDDLPCTLMICHDERFPELTRIPVLAGAQICFYLSYEINGAENAARKREGYRAQLIARAVENGIWVVQSNGVGPLRGDGPRSLGNSRIVAPDGTVLDEAPEMQEATLLREITPSEAKRGNALETWNNPALKAWWQQGLALMAKPAAP